ncbi:hypothetical protein OROHE_016067 [Orobanche hederae]
MAAVAEIVETEMRTVAGTQRAGFAFRFAPPRLRRVVLVKWELPPRGRLKLNTDASFSPTRSAGGAVLRDSYGTLVAALSFPLEATSAFEAEVLTLDLARIGASYRFYVLYLWRLIRKLWQHLLHLQAQFLGLFEELCLEFGRCSEWEELRFRMFTGRQTR